MRPSVQSRAVAEIPNIVRHPPPAAARIPVGLSPWEGGVWFDSLTWLLIDWYRLYRTFMPLKSKFIAPLATSQCQAPLLLNNDSSANSCTNYYFVCWNLG